jgi:hypothetical protein
MEKIENEGRSSHCSLCRQGFLMMRMLMWTLMPRRKEQYRQTDSSLVLHAHCSFPPALLFLSTTWIRTPVWSLENE